MTGNRTVIDALNETLEIERTAPEAYADQAEYLALVGLPKLAEAFRGEVAEELTHQRRLVERILFLEGEPTAEHYDHPDIDRKADPADAIPDLITADLALEMDGLKVYRKGIATARAAGDETSAGIMALNLSETEDHIATLEGYQKAIEAIGIQNWLASWAG